MAGWPSVLVTTDLADVAEDVHKVFQELDRAAGRPRAVTAGQCTPPVDVLETDETIELVVDLAGVPVEAMRVVLKGDVVIVAGEKVPSPPHGTGDYHLVERGSGRFARALRVTVAFDGARAQASLEAGELRVVLPKIHDRRGRARQVPIQSRPIGLEC